MQYKETLIFLWQEQDARVREPGLLLVHTMIECRGKMCTTAHMNFEKRFTSMKSDFSVQNNVVNVCCSYLSISVSIYCKCQVATRENMPTTTF